MTAKTCSGLFVTLICLVFSLLVGARGACAEADSVEGVFTVQQKTAKLAYGYAHICAGSKTDVCLIFSDTAIPQEALEQTVKTGYTLKLGNLASEGKVRAILLKIDEEKNLGTCTFLHDGMKKAFAQIYSPSFKLELKTFDGTIVEGKSFTVTSETNNYGEKIDYDVTFKLSLKK